MARSFDATTTPGTSSPPMPFGGRIRNVIKVPGEGLGRKPKGGVGGAKEVIREKREIRVSTSANPQPSHTHTYVHHKHTHTHTYTCTHTCTHTHIHTHMHIHMQ